MRESLILSEIFGLANVKQVWRHGDKVTFYGWKAAFRLTWLLATGLAFFGVINGYLTFDDIAKLYH
jgi:hypothetical protein